jgi:hypothetical protein
MTNETKELDAQPVNVFEALTGLAKAVAELSATAVELKELRSAGTSQLERVARLVNLGRAGMLETVSAMDIDEVRAAIAERERSRVALSSAGAPEQAMSVPPLLADLFYLEVYEAILLIVAEEHGQEIALRPGQNLHMLAYLKGQQR